MPATKDGAASALRAFAKKLPDVEVGVSCKGTAVEATTYNVKKKAFLFLRERDGRVELRIKVAASAPALKRLSAKDPGCYSIGAGGWAKISFPAEAPPLPKLLERWVDESYQGMAALRKPAGKK